MHYDKKQEVDSDHELVLMFREMEETEILGSSISHKKACRETNFMVWSKEGVAVKLYHGYFLHQICQVKLRGHYERLHYE